MIAIDRRNTVFPQKLRKRRTKALAKHKAELATLDSDDFNGGLYAHDAVKDRLWEAQSAKCCFCEQKYERKNWTVEHFRPKTSVRRSDAVRVRPDYWWLAYEMDNLFFCCPNCNSPKSDHFPLRNDVDALSAPMHPSDANAKEEPLVLDPSKEDPEKHIDWVWENGRGYLPVGLTDEGRTTIRLCKLDQRDDLVKLRYTYYKQHVMPALRNYVVVMRSANQDIRNTARDLLDKLLSPSALFAGMVRTVLRKKGIV